MIAREIMTANMAEREREIAQLAMAREAQRIASPSTKGRQQDWTWRVEPGMGEVFSSLRAWLLSRAGNRTVDYLPNAREPS